MTHPPSYNKDLEKSKKNNYINKIETNEQAPPPQQTNPSTTLPSWATSNPCLSDYGALQKTTDDNIIVHNTNNGKVKHYFYKNKNFLYKDTEDNSQVKGNWECVNGKLLIKTPIDNQQWNKEKGWHDIPENNSNTDTTTNTDTTLPSWVTSNPCLSRLTLSGTPNNQNKVYEIVGGGRGEEGRVVIHS
jgi:hypothetical protein